MLIFVEDLGRSYKEAIRKHDTIFLEKSYHGKFRNSYRVDHNYLARLALKNFNDDLRMKVFSLDQLTGFWGNTFMWMRVIKHTIQNNGNCNLFLYFSVQNLEFINPLVIKHMCKLNKLKSTVIMPDGCWMRNKVALRFYSSYFDFVSFWDEYNIKDNLGVKLIERCFLPFQNR